MTPPNSKTLEVLNELAARAGQILQQSPLADIEKNVRQQLIAQLAKQGLVTREEYEIQAAMLARAQVAVRELEAKIAVLEAARGAGHER